MFSAAEGPAGAQKSFDNEEICKLAVYNIQVQRDRP